MSQEGPDLWERVTAHHALSVAFAKVAANRGSAGGDGLSISDFNADLFQHLTQLRVDLLSGSYRSGLFRKVAVPKKKPGYRVLTIPTIRDRVVHTSIATTLTPILEPVFEDCSFAYRPGRGVVHAVERIERWRRSGYDVVIEADIVSYFDNIDHEILLQKLERYIEPLAGGHTLLILISKLLKDQAVALKTPLKGIVQGSPLSPILANLYLDALDEEIEDQGVKLVRYADDFVILCKSVKKAKKVLQHCVAVLEAHNLRLHDEGTRIVSFDKGFDFVGYLFVKSLALKEKSGPKKVGKAKQMKSNVNDEGVIEFEASNSHYDPGKRVLYLIDPDLSLKVRNRSFSVQREDDSELIALPYRRIGRIELGPSVYFDRKIVDLAIDTKIEIALIDGFGQTKGFVSHNQGRYSKRQFQQAKNIINEDFRVSIAKRIVEARIHNQRTQLMRLNRERDYESVDIALKKMKHNQRKIEQQKTVHQLRGIEGSSTAIYWIALGALIDENRPNKFKRQRPANDPFNSVLNYFTAILERDIRAAIHHSNLHVGFAYLHESRDHHHGLVYDLMEPFRAPLAEGAMVFLFNARRLKNEMFSTSSHGEVLISSEGRQAIITNYERAVAKRVNRPDKKGKLSWRAMMKFQVQSLTRAIEKENSNIFSPYIMEA